LIIRIPRKDNPHISDDEVIRGIKEICDDLDLKCDIEDKSNSRSIVVELTARLKKPVYNTYACTANENFRVELIGGKPYCVDIIGLGIKHPIRRGNYLQWCHWANLDNRINEFLDDLNADAYVKSAWGVIREGREWEWIDPENPVHEKYHSLLHTPGVQKMRRKRARKSYIVE